MTRHLYVHLPFCAHRCGYCDFVTVVGRNGQHDAYVGALLAELALERELLGPDVETVFLGGGTPTFTEPHALERLLVGLPSAEEVTVEANPETVTQELARMLRRLGVNRVSLGVQSFRPRLLTVLDRVAQPDTVRRAFYHLRDAGFDNISYELEAKPGTRFTHEHGEELVRQADAMESYFELVVATLTGNGYRWYETANFCREGDRDLRSRHNLAYWLGRDYLGLGIGAVSTIEGRRWRNTPKLRAYVEQLEARERPARELEPLPLDVQLRERVMLGLRLDEPLSVDGLGEVIDLSALERLERLGLAARSNGSLALTARGRMLGGGVTADLLA
jgi:coproporphyrinogen III oxidase-like Fe-S oxidoreductase